MSSRCSIALVGDYDARVPAHQAIPIALELAAAHHGVRIDADWIATSQIHHAETDFAAYQGIWCVPASPYENTRGALDAIRVARERRIPFLGTCGGFQHALIEYAQNVLGMNDTAHAETDPNASRPLIAQLSCFLVEKEGALILEPDSIIARSYGVLRTKESYRCNYGPNPDHEHTLFEGGLHVSARDPEGEVRAGELDGHPFFVGTLFQPERRALKRELPPLVRDFVGAAIEHQQYL